MNNELIKVDDSGKITARELYGFLELAPGSFARWAKTNIESDDFYSEGIDWDGFSIVLNGNETKDYRLTIDFAKHLCMLSRSEKGKQARSYFVEVEKRYRAPQSIEDLIIMQAQSMKEIRQRQEQQAALLDLHSAEIKQLAAKVTTRPMEYFTIAGYANLRGLKVDVSKANLLGRKAKILSQEYGVDTGKESDARYGQVNSYHIDILQEVFRDFT